MTILLSNHHLFKNPVILFKAFVKIHYPVLFNHHYVLKC